MFSPMQVSSDGLVVDVYNQLSEVRRNKSFAHSVKKLRLEANKQSYDSGLRRFVAEGAVKAFLQGGVLQADRIEFDSDFKTLYARGSVRFRKGAQYFQASSLRYNFLQEKGVLQDVYGVLDLKTVRKDFLQKSFSKSFDQAASQNSLSTQITSNLDTISCPPSLSPIPDWHPYPWSLTAWGGQMTNAKFGETLILGGDMREEYLLGIGLQKRIYRSGPFAVELEGNIFNHQAATQSGGAFNQPIPYSPTSSQNFTELVVGLGARFWIRPWLSFAVTEGVSYNNEVSNYEKTFRKDYSKFLNYLSFELETKLRENFSLVGRINHRSGAFGLFGGTREGSNAYLLGLRYRWGEDRSRLVDSRLNSPLECQDSKRVALSKTKSGELLSHRSKSLNLKQKEVRREQEIARIDQRIEDIRLRDKVIIEATIGVSSIERNADEKNRYGGVSVSQLNKRGRKRLIDGSITKWRVQAEKVIINQNSWNSDKMSFSNDPYTPSQTRIEAYGVTAFEENDGSILIKSRRNRLILDERLSIPIIRSRRFKKKDDVENLWVFGFDERDRDGFFVGRHLRPVEIGNYYTLFLQPQFNFQRSLLGKTNSYVGRKDNLNAEPVTQTAYASDLFGLKSELIGNSFGFKVDLNSEITSFNLDNISNASRYWGGLEKQAILPWIGNVSTRFFGSYRYRAWNGSLGETDIYSAYGAFLDKRGLLNLGRFNSNYLVRAGLGKYRADLFDSINEDDLWRANFYGSVNSNYPIWSGTKSALGDEALLRYSPQVVIPGLSINTNLRTSLSVYEGGKSLQTLTFSGGPSLTLGTFTKPYLDYTRLSITGSSTFKQGSSPFDFDQAVDLTTLGFGLTQQIAGALVLNTGFEMNVDSDSRYYGEVINSKIELRWQRRSYDLALYMNPQAREGGFTIRLNDFDFRGTGVPFVPYK